MFQQSAVGIGEGSTDVTGSIAQRTDQGLSPAPKLGYSGAAALDAQGRFAGMVALKAPMIAGPGAAPLATLVPAAALSGTEADVGAKATALGVAVTWTWMEPETVTPLCVVVTPH